MYYKATTVNLLEFYLCVESFKQTLQRGTLQRAQNHEFAHPWETLLRLIPLRSTTTIPVPPHPLATQQLHVQQV
jgi:hypothetical protein